MSDIKIGRPPKSGGTALLDAPLRIRVLSADKAWLEAQADAQSVSVGDLVRALITQARASRTV